MNQSFSSKALQDTVDTVTSGQRDLLSEQLADFYDVTSAVLRDSESRYEEVLEFRTNNDLPAISAASFVTDLSFNSGINFFQKVQNSQGVETTFEEDLVTASVTNFSPNSVGAFIDKEARKIAKDTAALEELLSFQGAQTTIHLLEGDPASVADEDQETFDRLKNSHRYTRKLIQ